MRIRVGTLLSLYAKRRYDNLRHMTHSGHGYPGYPLVTPFKFWPHLPADFRGDIETPLATATHHGNQVAKKNVMSDKKAIIDQAIPVARVAEHLLTILKGG